MVISLGRWTTYSLDEIISKASKFPDPGKRIDYISGLFKGTPYADNTLKRGVDLEEELVVNLDKVDCFTFIDYVEAMRLSDSFNEFLSNLKKVRYQCGKVDFTKRNHFFTDWEIYNSDFVDDITAYIGMERAVRIEKTLNLKDDGSFFVPGIGIKKRRLIFIPSQDIERGITEKLRTGDYAGIYSNRPGLDVSHVGIIIRDEKRLYLRHASSKEKYKMVMDEDFAEYIKTKDGLIVLRPK